LARNTLKLFEAQFTFTPDDETSGEGILTITAETVEEARKALEDVLGEVTDLQITEIREIAVLPDNVPFEPRTLQ
jgi:hypothetical protein